MLVLVTNDDGIASEGLAQLAFAVLDAGYEVIVAAPPTDSSGSSCALTSVQDHGRTLFESQTLPGLEDVPALAVSAAPAMITLMALRGAFGPPPALVASGINDGANTGRAVIHSGTVGAALTAATYGTRSLAVSMQEGEPRHWETVRQLALRSLEWLPGTPAATALNLNVPNVALEDLAGVRTARLAPFGTVQTQVTEADEGWVKLDYHEPTEQADPDSDAALLAQGYATLTALDPITESVLPELETFVESG